MAVRDITKRPRRALSAEERQELFREFKLGLFALAALVALVVTLCWDRDRAGRSGAAPDERTNDDGTALVRVVWQPGDQGGVPRARPDLAPRRVEEPPARRAEPEGERRQEAGPEGDRAAPRRGQEIDPVRREPEPPQYRNYVVKRRDTLWKIAEKVYGDGKLYKLIQKANPALRNPNSIRYGMVIRLPLLPGGATADTQLAEGQQISSADRLLQSPTSAR